MKGWYYRKCCAYNRKLGQQSFEPHCPDDDPQPVPNYGYWFRAVIDDGTATTTITCFSPKTHTRHVPDALKQVENTTPIFQYHFGKGARPGDPDFNLDAVFKPSTQPLLSLPAPQPTTPPSSETLQQTTSTVRNHNINAE
uniref:Nucleic acid-binding, OB-fold protein n=1 Tax=Tanacetum cinerariifolium TaxID=118510 RepID=A0A6L2L2D3_TANCI|nr:hypothetical protein [Tanacetum cinerariifolium]